jgi:catechol 2,3-dioxygenase-like lactoylglutathione lyase family enzyme
MPRVVGIDHLVLSVGDFERSKEFYAKLLEFLGFRLKYDYADMAGWSNRKTLFWIAAADDEGKKRKYRKDDIGFHHYAFELASRNDVDALGAFLQDNGMNVVDPPGEYYGQNYYAVYFTDPDGMKLEGMIWAPPQRRRRASPNKAAKKTAKKTKRARRS